MKGVAEAALAAALLLFAQERVPRLASATEQLHYARGVLRAARELEGLAGERAREQAVEAYRAVGRLHPEAVRLAAEASFRAGEQLRAAGRSEEALREFRTVRRFDPLCSFAGRALLEIGHLHRRAGRTEEALDAYVALCLERSARPAESDLAALWAGRVSSGAGDVRGARRMWDSVARQAVDPVLRIAAHDELMEAWLALGDLEAAAGQWELCRASVRDEAREATELGGRVRRALEGMRSVEQLVTRIHERASRRGDP